METGRVRRKFALKTRKWMEMGLGKRAGMDWIPKICPVKGFSWKCITVSHQDTCDMAFDHHVTSKGQLQNLVSGHGMK